MDFRFEDIYYLAKESTNEIKTLLYILIGIAAVTLILTIWNTIKKK